jgi:hypothetical protein
MPRKRGQQRIISMGLQTVMQVVIETRSVLGRRFGLHLELSANF